ncbi:MAG: glycoside hydrolase family 20 zincin-like fold domain-containing protein [Promethearchaeota archaeon]
MAPNDSLSISHNLIPLVKKTSKGALDQFCSIIGSWTVSSNAGSDNLVGITNQLTDSLSPKPIFQWDLISTPEKSDLNYRSDLGYFQPRQPLYLLFLPEDLTINPQLIIEKINWMNSWNIHDFRSTDEYLLIIGRFVQISSRTERGLFYGLQTLSQLLRYSGNAVPYQTLHDSPQSSLRSIDITWMIPDLEPTFIQRILQMAGEYKINSIHIQADNHVPTAQFEVEFAKNYLSFGKYLKKVETAGSQKQFSSQPWVQTMITMGLYPILHYDIVWKAACSWEGRAIPEASFISRYWRNFFFDQIDASDKTIIEDPKLPIIFSNLLTIFAELPVQTHELPILVFLKQPFTRLIAKLTAQQQTLEHFRILVQNTQIRAARNSEFLSIFALVIENSLVLQALIRSREQSQNLLDRVFSGNDLAAMDSTDITQLSQWFDDVIRLIHPAIEKVHEHSEWYLQPSSEILINAFGLKDALTKVQELSQVLNGYLQYKQKLQDVLKSWM